MTEIKRYVEAAQGREALDLKICNAKVVNVFNDTVTDGDIGIVGKRIVCVGDLSAHPAKEVLDAGGNYAVPGFIDSHMHMESSMLTPANFAKVALENGTTSCAADPHEIGNVLGFTGVKALIEASRGLPLHFYFFAPSTIPSAPGFEDAGFEVGAQETETFMNMDGIHGLGEIMDFNGVANGEDHILSVIETARRHGTIIDGHVPVLTGWKLQAFRASGIDSDHCVNTAEKLLEDISLGITAEVQGNNMSPELAKILNEAPVNNRLCICTDDVSLTILLHHGHLNYAVEKAIEMGLDPVKAVRFVTINAADRMRLYDTGAIAPGRIADIQIMPDLRHPKPLTVLSEGTVVVRDGRFCGSIEPNTFPDEVYHSMKLDPLCEKDFASEIEIGRNKNGKALVNMMQITGSVFRTVHIQRELPFSCAGNGKGILDSTGYVKFIIFNRHGKDQHAYDFIEGLGQVDGAIAITYSHDSHNLSVYGTNDRDMAVAANAVIGAGGGFAVAKDGKVLSLVPLPIAGLLTHEDSETMLKASDDFCACCKQIGIDMENPLHFFTFMPLAVCPDMRCTDKGLIDVLNKKIMPLVESISYDD